MWNVDTIYWTITCWLCSENFLLFTCINLHDFFQFADKISLECLELYEKYDPRPCCDIPTLFQDEELIRECSARCESQPFDACCLMDCLLEVSEVYVNGTQTEAKVMETHRKLITKYGEEAMTKWHQLWGDNEEHCQKLGVKITCTSNYAI